MNGLWPFMVRLGLPRNLFIIACCAVEFLQNHEPDKYRPYIAINVYANRKTNPGAIKRFSRNVLPQVCVCVSRRIAD